MSSAREIIVERRYTHTEQACSEALHKLLVQKKAVGVTSTNGDDVKESESESRRRTSIPETD